MKAFSIQDIAHLTGIKAHTIRIWEQRYGILSPERTSSNIRKYSNEDLKKILNIALLNERGIKISKLCEMTSDELEAAVHTSEITADSPQRIINALLEVTSNMDVKGVENVLDDTIKTHGYTFTIEEVIFPLLNTIGKLWVTNKLFSSQEHMLSNLIRQKLITAIDRLPHPDSTETDIIIFLPEGEYHEIGLLYAHWLCKSAQLGVLSFGANMPLDDLIPVCERLETVNMFTHITSLGTYFDINAYLKSYSNAFPGKKLYLSGLLTKQVEQKPENVHIIESLHQFKQLIKTLQSK